MNAVHSSFSYYRDDGHYRTVTYTTECGAYPHSASDVLQQNGLFSRPHVLEKINDQWVITRYLPESQCTTTVTPLTEWTPEPSLSLSELPEDADDETYVAVSRARCLEAHRRGCERHQ